MTLGGGVQAQCFYSANSGAPIILDTAGTTQYDFDVNGAGGADIRIFLQDDGIKIKGIGTAGAMIFSDGYYSVYNFVSWNIINPSSPGFTTYDMYLAWGSNGRHGNFSRWNHWTRWFSDRNKSRLYYIEDH